MKCGSSQSKVRPRPASMAFAWCRRGSPLRLETSWRSRVRSWKSSHLSNALRPRAAETKLVKQFWCDAYLPRDLGRAAVLKWRGTRAYDLGNILEAVGWTGVKHAGGTVIGGAKLPRNGTLQPPGASHCLVDDTFVSYNQ